MIVPDSREPGSVVFLVLTEEVGLVADMEIRVTQPDRRNERLTHGVRNMIEEQLPSLVPATVRETTFVHPLVAHRLLICQQSTFMTLPHQGRRMVDPPLTCEERTHDLVRLDSLLTEPFLIQTACAPGEVTKWQECLDVNRSIPVDIHHELQSTLLYTRRTPLRRFQTYRDSVDICLLE